MEADWEVEIGSGGQRDAPVPAPIPAPIIDACWEGLADLRRSPELAASLPEAVILPALANALVRLNSTGLPVWTAKCDVWPLESGEFDPDEMGAAPEDAACGWACYIDLLAKKEELWATPEAAVAWSQSACGTLGSIALAACRADLVVRQAAIAPDRFGYGVTAYLSACGASVEAAKRKLQRALHAFADALERNSTVEW